MKISPKHGCDSNALQFAQLMGSKPLQTSGSQVPRLKGCGLKHNALSRVVIVTLQTIQKTRPMHQVKMARIKYCMESRLFARARGFKLPNS